jgi:hypothetical protein
MSVLSRISRKITQHGETLMVNGVTPVKGFPQVLDTGRMRTYLDDVEVSMTTRPALLLVTSPDAAIKVDDTITRDERVYTVRKVSIERSAGQAAVKIAILI